MGSIHGTCAFNVNKVMVFSTQKAGLLINSPPYSQRSDSYPPKLSHQKYHDKYVKILEDKRDITDDEMGNFRTFIKYKKN